MILLDIQNNQREEVAAMVTNSNHPVISNIPIVTMSVHSISGKTVNEIKQDTTSNVRGWVLSHEFRASYRDSLTSSETIKSGVFTPEAQSNKTIPISVSENFADNAKVTIGDNITFNVQGILMDTQVGSIRIVDWSQMQVNFNVLFPKGVLENAPQFSVLSTYVPNEKASAQLQQELVTKFPNVSILDLRQLLSIVEKLLNKIGWIINFMAFFSILTGVIVLIGALRNSKHQRIKESVILRTLGAKKHQILKIVALEYTFLGVIGSLTGVILSLIGSQLLALWIFKAPFVPSAVPFTILFPGITLLVLSIGLINSKSVITNTPLEVLRKEKG
jgi:putative ABC transport system permease protein